MPAQRDHRDDGCGPPALILIAAAIAAALFLTAGTGCDEDDDCTNAEQLNNECAPNGGYGPNGDQSW